MSEGFRAEWVELADMPAHRSAWGDLVTRALEPNIFGEPAFALAAARHLAKPPGPRFLLVWSGSAGQAARLVGLCIVARPQWRPVVCRAFAHPQATAAFPLLDAALGEAVVPVILGTLATMRGRPAALALVGVALDGPTTGLLTQMEWPFATVAPRLRAVLRAGASEPGLSSKAAKEIRRQERRLAEQGHLTVGTSADFSDTLDRFLALEASGWKGRRRTALSQAAGRRAFVTEAAHDLTTSGQLRLHTLALDGEPIAMGLVLRSGTHAWFWKTAYDERYARFSPGVQLALRITAVHSSDSTLSLTDSCAIPGHTMIDRLWRDRASVADILVATRHKSNAAFALACAAERWRRGLRGHVKRVVATIRSRFGRRLRDASTQAR